MLVDEEAERAIPTWIASRNPPAFPDGTSTRAVTTSEELLLDTSVTMMSEFYHALQHVFVDDSAGKTPKASRLIHGMGVVALGYVY
ncbi:hypothetical protein CIT26_09080 [Mesorhizobium temperatum]|uniref:Uncharacterized protein n=2 Tax=Mesorhizobium temperatum TaxID=241416 RepID=A0A271LSI4_9HYPH|nr:hypothetical protein CIT26_09080 [Mesorhizobium temperatum]